MVFGEARIFLIATGFLKGHLRFFVIDIRKPFEEQNRCHVALILILIDRTTQNVAGLKQMGKELLTCRFFRMGCAGIKFKISNIHS